MSTVIWVHPKTKEEFDAIITIAKAVGINIKTSFKKINEFPYIVISDYCLYLHNTSIEECDKHGLNRKDFIGIIRYLIQRLHSQLDPVWKLSEDENGELI